MSISNQSADYTLSQGSAAIGARLRRLSERIDRDLGQVYANQGAEFEQRWFGPFNQLRLRETASVGEIAAAIGVTHAAVSQSCSQLQAKGLIETDPAPSDKRRRQMRLSPAGIRLARQLAPMWDRLELLSRDLDAAAGGLVAAIDRLETALAEQSIADRYNRIASSAD